MVLKIVEPGQTFTIKFEIRCSCEKHFCFTEHHEIAIRNIVSDYLRPFVKEDK